MYIESKSNSLVLSISRMASANHDNNVSRSQKEITICNNNSNDNPNNNQKTRVRQSDHSDDNEKKLLLEQRKKSLEGLLKEKFWFLQQIQKKEVQILNGDYEYINLNDIFLGLENQYKPDINTFLTSVGSETTSILRRTCFTYKHDHQTNNNFISHNSNRTSEYDNYPGNTHIELKGLYEQHTNENSELEDKPAANKWSVPNTKIKNFHYMHVPNLQQQPRIQKKIEDSFVSQNDEKLKSSPHQKQFNKLQPNDRVLSLQQLHHNHKIPNDNNFLTSQQSHCIPQNQLRQSEGISVISVNSSNSANLIKNSSSTQAQSMIIQSDKYYLSPTHQTYNEGNFIKCSQNIKKYVSPINSPLTCTTRLYGHGKYEFQHLQKLYKEQQCSPLQQVQSQVLDGTNQYQQRPIDIISLDPSYTSMDSDTIQNLRWRSQTSIPLTVSCMQNQDIKSNSSDMLLHMTTSPPKLYCFTTNDSKQPFDEISICSLNNELQKKTKPKQWTESSLDGPIMRMQVNSNEKCSHSVNQHTQQEISIELPNIRVTHKSQTIRDRNKLSSQSMSSSRYYSKSDHNAFQYFQNDDGRVAKLSQSTSFLNSSENVPVYPIDGTPIQKINHTNTSSRSPSSVSLLNSSLPSASSSLSPDIRIESPKNMTVIQQATFQPYKEITKPFEMADFYKYSTKYRQKESTGSSKLKY